MEFESITLLTERLEETKQFYINNLGFRLIEEADNTFTVQVGATNLIFEITEPGSRPFYHFAMNVPHNKFQEVKQWTASRVDLIRQDGDDEVYFDAWNADSVYFEDPSGNIVEFIARHNLDNGITHAFSTEDILCISEIGVATDEVGALVGKLNAIGIPNWQDVSETFAAVGDEHGLFIVVKERRVWYFSNGKKARYFPIQATVKGLGNLIFTQEQELVVDLFK